MLDSNLFCERFAFAGGELEQSKDQAPGTRFTKSYFCDFDLFWKAKTFLLYWIKVNDLIIRNRLTDWQLKSGESSFSSPNQ